MQQMKQNPEGKLAQNVLYFARTLRGAGMRIGPAAMVDAVRAIETCGISNRDDFYWTLHCVMVIRREDHAVFDEAFRLFWRSRELVEKMLQMFSPVANPAPSKERQRAAQSRVAQSLFPEQAAKQNVEKPEVEVDAVFTASQKEILRRKDFAQMNADELAQARNELTRLQLPFQEVKTRRFISVNRVRKIDMRKTFSSSLRTGGDLLLPRFQQKRTRLPPIVILADISGSMSQYSRLFLHFFHALSESRQRVHTFLFGTRLTNITRQLRMKDPDEALAQCSDAVEDWSGGTRIGRTLEDFNRLWSRRGLGQGADVLLITDGLERDKDHGLEKQMDRLHLSCRRLIWLNPLLRYDGFEARANGIRAMLPHVDEFRAVHSLDAIADLCQALSGNTQRRFSPRKWLDKVEAEGMQDA
ncbi:MAG: VWA domain-containing protein [Rhizobiaceae bacterium]|nr:VWA domain-containing protein [Rhizobiaceae bacterium]